MGECQPFVLFRPSTDRSAVCGCDLSNLLSKSTHLNVNLIPNHSRCMMFDQISRHLGPAKLTHKINHHTYKYNHLWQTYFLCAYSMSHTVFTIFGVMFQTTYLHILTHLILTITLMQVLLLSLLHSWGNSGITIHFLSWGFNTCPLALEYLYQDHHHIIYYTNETLLTVNGGTF